MKRFLALLVSHAIAVFAGFAAGIYALPIITAPPGPASSELQSASETAIYTGEFRRDLADSDALHWGEGTVRVGLEAISLEGSIAPGPDYKLYLSPEFVETETDFNRLKSQMVQVGDVKTFENFLVPVPPQINPADYAAVIIWCESFGQFITATRYR